MALRFLICENPTQPTTFCQWKFEAFETLHEKGLYGFEEVIFAFGRNKEQRYPPVSGQNPTPFANKGPQ